MATWGVVRLDAWRVVPKWSPVAATGQQCGTLACKIRPCCREPSLAWVFASPAVVPSRPRPDFVVVRRGGQIAHSVEPGDVGSGSQLARPSAWNLIRLQGNESHHGCPGLHYPGAVLLAVATNQRWYSLTWVDWFSVIGVFLTVVGLALTWVQARKATTAANAAGEAIRRTEQQFALIN